jgi:23S rRNA G2445 N2-methylase RlmL
MKALAITHKGLEDISETEIKELIKKDTEKQLGCVIFETNSFDDLALVCYKAQSIKKLVLLLDSKEVKSIKDIKTIIKKNVPELKNYINEEKTFAVRCLKLDNEDLLTDEICLEAADSISINSRVNLKNPDAIVFIYLAEKICYLGIDLSGEDLSKRDYRIYVHQEALKATIAYSLLRISNYTQKDIILDPFCGSGTILIEAALFATNFSPNFYSKEKFAFLKLKEIDLNKFDAKKELKGKLIGYDKELRHVVAAKKNAKIAGIEDTIEFSRCEIEWIDTKIKIKEKSIDKIITNPPNLTKRINENVIGKLYTQLFYQADFILKTKGTVTVITKTEELMKQSAEKYKFKVITDREILIGQDIHKILVFQK